MRASHDCLITSVNTIIADNPRLNCRIPGLDKKSPARVIIDKKLKIPFRSHVVNSSSKHRTIIFYHQANIKKLKKLKKYNIRLIKTPLLSDNNFDLNIILRKIGQLGFYRIFLESGAKLTANFLKFGLVNNMQLFISNKKLGKEC